ncbi:MAG: hypothetical protein PWP61_1086, partial [Trichococcus sp.]|nr:hypothetical protein [Trichococcus sp.]
SIITIWPIVMDVIPANNVSIYSLPPKYNNYAMVINASPAFTT